jgi:hypothetical protein
MPSGNPDPERPQDFFSRAEKRDAIVYSSCKTKQKPVRGKIDASDRSELHTYIEGFSIQRIYFRTGLPDGLLSNPLSMWHSVARLYFFKP